MFIIVVCCLLHIPATQCKLIANMFKTLKIGSLSLSFPQLTDLKQKILAEWSLRDINNIALL